MFCLTCNAEKHPIQVFTADGFVDRCPTCPNVFARHDEPLQDVPDEAALPAAAPVRQAPPPPKPASMAVPPDALSQIDQLRARLTFCEEQIAVRDGYIDERDMLRKMLAAADGETRPASASVFTN
jgi:hypothetical protein